MAEQGKSKKTNQSGASDSSIEDKKLVADAKKGDQKAYSKLVEKYERALYYHVRKMVRSNQVIEDLVQESFSKAFNSLDSYDDNYAFSTWLYRITTNHTIDYLRKKKLQTVSMNKPIRTKEGDMERSLPDKETQTDRKVIRDERKNIITNAIENLPEKYRTVIKLRHMEELSYQEIAEKRDMPLGTVKAHIFRARELLYAALKDKRDTF